MTLYRKILPKEMTNAQLHSETKKATCERDWNYLQDLIDEKVDRTVRFIMKDIEKNERQK